MISLSAGRSYLTSNRRWRLSGIFCEFYDNFNKEKALGMLESLHIDLHARLKPFPRHQGKSTATRLWTGMPTCIYWIVPIAGGVDPAAVLSWRLSSAIILKCNDTSPAFNIRYWLAVLDICIFIRTVRLCLLLCGKSAETYGNVKQTAISGGVRMLKNYWNMNGKKPGAYLRWLPHDRTLTWYPSPQCFTRMSPPEMPMNWMRAHLYWWYFMFSP